MIYFNLIHRFQLHSPLIGTAVKVFGTGLGADPSNRPDRSSERSQRQKLSAVSREASRLADKAYFDKGALLREWGSEQVTRAASFILKWRHIHRDPVKTCNCIYVRNSGKCEPIFKKCFHYLTAK